MDCDIEVLRDMLAIITDVNVTDDEFEAALDTIMEMLFPSEPVDFDEEYWQ